MIKPHTNEKKYVVERDSCEVAGFDVLYELMKQRISISEMSDSTPKNCSHHLAKMVLHFGELPTNLDEDQIYPVGSYLTV